MSLLRLPYETEPRELNAEQIRFIKNWLKNRAPYENFPNDLEPELSRLGRCGS